jgi:hypothetical protein
MGFLISPRRLPYPRITITTFTSSSPPPPSPSTADSSATEAFAQTHIGAQQVLATFYTRDDEGSSVYLSDRTRNGAPYLVVVQVQAPDHSLDAVAVLRRFDLAIGVEKADSGATSELFKEAVEQYAPSVGRGYEVVGQELCEGEDRTVVVSQRWREGRQSIVIVESLVEQDAWEMLDDAEDICT